MIIACPACATRYVVPDSAIGIDGRTVRCAKCRHSWFQDGPQLAPRAQPQPVLAEAGAASSEHGRDYAPPPEPAPRADPAPAPEPPIREPETVFAPRRDEKPDEAAPDQPLPPPPTVEPEAVPAFAETAREPPVAPWIEEVSSFAAKPPFRPRRNPAKMWTAGAIAFAVLVTLLIGAVSYWGLPSWLPIPRPTFAAAAPDLVLEFPPERQDRRTLPNGTEFFGASGSVTNVGQETRDVPPILIVLRDGRERIVYTWEVRAPKSELAPGESVTINEAVTDVPRSAKIAEIGWKPG